MKVFIAKRFMVSFLFPWRKRIMTNAIHIDEARYFEQLDSDYYFLRAVECESEQLYRRFTSSPEEFAQFKSTLYDDAVKEHRCEEFDLRFLMIESDEDKIVWAEEYKRFLMMELASYCDRLATARVKSRR
jgi:hypothetical protein